MKDRISTKLIEHNCIAIIGMACCFPGADNVEVFWENLFNEKDTLSHFSNEKLQAVGIPEDLFLLPNYIKTRGILNHIELFDAEYFGLTQYEAKILDPQQRVFLKLCWELLIKRGYLQNKHKKTIGVFGGISENTYLHQNLLRNADFNKTNHYYQTYIASSHHFLSTKVSYLLNLKGPSLTISTACSTSLVSIIKACQSILLNECDMALAGGVSIRVPQINGYLYQEGSIFSSDGKCKPFDSQASGTVSSNGAGVVLLKRYQDAVSDNDNIDAVIKGFALNNDGNAKIGFTAPSILEQAKCIETALSKIDAASISYIEAHGTATKLGDPIEIAGLTKAFRRYTKEKNFCAIGSVKSNIGHTDTASGVAGLIKTVLALKYKTIPASLYFSQPNPAIDFKNSPFYVNAKTSNWQPKNGVRRAGVNSLGIGGTNAHIILEEAIQSNIKEYLPLPTLNKNHYWVEPTEHLESQNKQKEVLTYHPYWEISALPNSEIDLPKSTWIIFVDESGICEKLLNKLLEKEQNVIRIVKGEVFESLNSDTFKINPYSKNDYEEVLMQLKNKNLFPTKIIYAWALTNEQYFLQTSHQNYIDFIYIIQTFLANKNIQITLLTIVNQFASIIPGEKIEPIKSTLYGLSVVASQEYNVLCKVIDIDITESESNYFLNNLFQEMVVKLSASLIAYRRGIRFIQQFKPYDILTQPLYQFLKNGGVYLITGGLGKAGLLIANFLAKTYNAHLILTTRSQANFESLPDDKTLTKIEDIKKYAASFAIIQADVSSYEQMKSVFEYIKNKHENLSGIFHLAAIVDLSSRILLLKDLSVEKMNQHYLAKIQGTQVIEKLTHDFPAGFCLMFSSISSVIGGIGLSSYSASNCYLNSFCEYKRNDPKNKTVWISLSWDALKFDESDDSHTKKIASIAPQNILKQLSNINYLSVSHLIISLDNLNNKLTENINQPFKTISEKYIDVLNTNSTQSRLNDIFKNCLGKENIDINESFYNLGGDSLAAIHLLELIEKEFSVSFTFSDLIENPSLSQLMQLLEIKQRIIKNELIINLSQPSEKQPLFLIHPLASSVYCYLELAKFISAEHPCYAVQDPIFVSKEYSFSTLGQLASVYLQEIRKIQPQSPYLIGGYSFGGNVAFEIARQLLAMGEKVSHVLIIDGWAAYSPEIRDRDKMHASLQRVSNQLNKNIPEYIHKKNELIDLFWSRMTLLFDYQMEAIPIQVVLFKCKEILQEYQSIDEMTNHWSACSTMPVMTYDIEGNHHTILERTGAEQIGNYINLILKDLEQINH